MKENRFYVYMWLRADGEPYFIGRGAGQRRWRKRKEGRAQPPSDEDKNFLYQDGLTEIQALELERRLIRLWGWKDRSPPPPPLSKDDLSEICKLYAIASDIWTFDMLAALHNISVARVKKILKDRGVAADIQAREESEESEKILAEQVRLAKQLGILNSKGNRRRHSCHW